MAKQVTITGYQVLYMAQNDLRSQWQPVLGYKGPLMAEALDALPRLVRSFGYGDYKIMQTLSNGGSRCMFLAKLIDKFADAPARLADLTG